jgi:hypothetical protein
LADFDCARFVSPTRRNRTSFAPASASKSHTPCFETSGIGNA